MTISDISITAGGVIESTIIYGIVHGIWVIIKWLIKQVEHKTAEEIRAHVKNGHNTRFKYCLEGSCAKLQTGIDSLRLLGQ